MLEVPVAFLTLSLSTLSILSSKDEVIGFEIVNTVVFLFLFLSSSVFGDCNKSLIILFFCFSEILIDGLISIKVK